MIDFNDPTKAESSAVRVPIDYSEINRVALGRMQSLLDHFAPGGKTRGSEWERLNPMRSDRTTGSFRVNTATGKWADFAPGGGSGGDPISLVAYLECSGKQSDAAKLLGDWLGLQNGRAKIGAHANGATNGVAHPAVSGYEQIVPAPTDLDIYFPPHRLGIPAVTWDYRDAAGNLLCIVGRFNLPDGSKEFAPLTAWRHPKGHQEWRWKALEKPRPLYGLDRLSHRPNAPVIICEGEKKALAAERRFPGYVGSCSAGGAAAATSAFWGSLAGRAVLVWPDNDAAGLSYAADVCRLAIEAGATSARVVQLPSGFPDKWDLADDNPDGWTDEAIAELLEAPSEASNVIDLGSERLKEVVRRLAQMDSLRAEQFMKGEARSLGVPVQELRTSVKAERRPKRAGPGGKPSWHSKLLMKLDGDPHPILENAMVAFREADEWQGMLAYDEFRHQTVVRGLLPWDTSSKGEERDWTPNDDALANAWLQRNGVYLTHMKTCGLAIEAVAHETAFHPIRDYLDGLSWDGRPRIDDWAITYLGVDPSDYVRAVSARWLMSAVARVTNPGCKADCALVLEGKQGIKKSTALKTLFDPWYTDDIADLGTKDSSMQVDGVWLIEIAELASMKGREAEKVKSFMSRSTERFRPPYSPRLVKVGRQSVFAATTNISDPFDDETGARRFWPVLCTQIDIDGLSTDRDQLWAEARDRYRSGEKWWLDSKELIADAEIEQRNRYRSDPWERIIREWASDKNSVSIEHILRDALNILVKDWTQFSKNRVARCLIAMRWQRYQSREPDGSRSWGYRRLGSDGYPVTSVTTDDE